MNWITRSCFIAFWGAITSALIAFLANKKQEVLSSPASYILDGSTQRLISHPTRTADTTAIILNWSRFPNVIQIVENLCQQTDDFAECPENRLKITNSVSNLYFQARFFGCAEAETEFCYIQDDDYIVLPEIIRALRVRMRKSTSAIYLLPPHEMLSSELKRIRVGESIHTSFAWLGHGSIMRPGRAQEFLALLKYLNTSDEEMQMADNYYSVLGNVYPEVWFDQGIELGGGIAFTQGVEGEERNNRHIFQAAKYLDTIMTCESPPCTGKSVPFVSFERQAPPSGHRAPCVGFPCLLETTVSLLPATQIDVESTTHMLKIERHHRESLKETDTNDYLLHPPSHAVDGKPETAFCLPRGTFVDPYRIRV
ncbi:hypothetical protein BDP27DRAFT_1213649 [Rhodocollybia butyracea]|uniref:Uncharacterized protein n=1 Tax=Rhodocollybia butyracea TaxID=206335 RepID=A0A9P5Q3Q5_9AGAR|nr:hypothetical protein BDP27DRAFT_1213649 [Rhodocollybia butyracea]